MKRKYAFLLSLLITLLIASNIILLNSWDEKRKVFVTQVIDGDTFKAGEETFRLLNINAPELSERGYQEAKDFLSSIENKEVRIEETSTDKYGRTLVRVYTPEYLNLEIIKRGLATKFLVHESETSKFAEAEKKAVQSGRGIWKRSSKFGCFETKILEKKEIVKIKSLCGKIQMQNFILADESRKRYKFPKIFLTEVNLHTAHGIDNETDLFWNNQGNIWNNDRDTLYLFDSEGLLAHYYSYGY